MTLTRREFGKLSLGVATALAAGSHAAIAGPADLIRRAIPSSGETIPVIGLGTNRYGVGDSTDERAPLREALSRFHQLGGTVIDTAPMYRSSETVLGDLIDGLDIRDDLFLATKVDKQDRDATDAEIHESLDKLQTDTIDLLQVHNLIDWRESIPLLRDWKQDGRVRYIGITTSRSDQYGDMETVMKQHDLDFIQVNYSLEQRESADRLLPLAADRGMAVMINRAFGGGRIFDAVGDQPLPEWTADLGIDSWAQFLLKYALSHPAATVAIPGMTKARHVDDNFGAGHGPMPDAKLRTKMEAFYDSL